MSMDISPEEPAATNTMDTVVDANEPSAAASESTNAEPIATEPTDNGPTDAELTNAELNHAEPADVELADTEPADTEPSTTEQVMTDVDTTEPINTTIVTDAVADNADPPAIIATTTATGLSPSPQTAENGLSPGYTAAGVPTSSETGDDGPSTPMSGQSAVVATATPRPQPDTIDGRSTKTGYVYDVRMRFHQNIHGDNDHPEDPRRIWKIYEALKNAGCLTRMVKLPSREATQAELGLVHTEEHIQTITDTAKMDREQLLDVANSYNSIYLSAESAICARLSCGNLLELCSAVATGKVLNGVAIVRPPGHHAEPDEAGGFCLFNNVAIAARFLQKEHGLKKIFILDWDVHHGNGTQKAFLDDPDVVYCSIHRYDDGTFYPGDPVAAALDMIGVGKGRGKNINIPWPCSGMGDAEYIYAFHKVVMPIVYEFAPDFVLVSAGFDAAAGDHIGENLVSPAAYGHMTHMLKSLAGGKIVLALEGGYNLESIAVSGLACTKALLSDPIPALGSIIPNPACIQTIHEVLEVQSRYWRSITPTFIDPTEEKQEGWNVVELSKVLGVYRSDFLYKEHRMLKLPISNASYGADFLDNVHCTQQLYSTKPLYIFIHNVGEFRARTMGANNILRPDKSKMLDTVAHYVERIVQSGNELIDIVVPYQPATEDDKEPLKDKLTELLCDIWDNFVYMTGDTRRIVLLATGFGCYSMISFMNERQKDVARYVSCAVVVPGGDEAVPMVTRRLANWYMDHSFVVVADDHPVWERVNQKMSNRTGNIVRSGRPSERLSESLPRLYNTLFLEIERRIKALPPLDPPNYMLDLQEPLSNSSNNRNGVNDGSSSTEAMIVDSGPVALESKTSTEQQQQQQQQPYTFPSNSVNVDHAIVQQVNGSNLPPQFHSTGSLPSSLSEASTPFADSHAGPMTSSSVSSVPDVAAASSTGSLSSRGSNNNPLVDRSTISAVQSLQRSQPYPTLASSSTTTSQLFNGRSPSVGSLGSSSGGIAGSSPTPAGGHHHQQQQFPQGIRSTSNMTAQHPHPSSPHHQYLQQQQQLLPQQRTPDLSPGPQDLHHPHTLDRGGPLLMSGGASEHHDANSPRQQHPSHQHQHQQHHQFQNADEAFVRQRSLSSDNP
ncbi:Histone deacetylase hda1 [Linnemannia hyalina]|uniref:histone deacetylase n=1 Tax=Linnemannia hyalina TaxID=64524 RepID=A0A9P7XRG1_9FUNG|nr:Histone deacetylase hda1 [Linnemannia hyalina]